MIRDYLQMAMKNLVKRKLRSWLTILGIIIAIATIFVLISISVGLKDAINEQFRMLGTDKIFIMPKGQLGAPGTASASVLTKTDVDNVDKVRGVLQSTYFTAANAMVEYNSEKRYFAVAGLPLDQIKLYEEIQSFSSDEGRMIKTGDVDRVTLGYDFKYNKVFSKPVRAGDKILINGHEFSVVGIMSAIGNPGDDKNIYMNIEDVKKYFNTGDRVDEIVVQVTKDSNISDVAERIKKKLRITRNVDKDQEDFSLLTPDELLGTFSTILDIITVFLLGVAAISLLVGGVNIMNTMYTSVIERTKEIGTMKAVGAQNKDIILIFLIESGLLGIVGGLAGVLLGYGAAKVIESIVVQSLGTTLLRAAAPPWLFIGCLLFAFLAGAISGIWPAWGASKIKIVEALRYE